MDLGKYCIFRLSSAAITNLRQLVSSNLVRPYGAECFVFIIFDNNFARRSPSCANMTPANPTMKGLEL